MTQVGGEKVADGLEVIIKCHQCNETFSIETAEDVTKANDHVKEAVYDPLPQYFVLQCGENNFLFYSKSFKLTANHQMTYNTALFNPEINPIDDHQLSDSPGVCSVQQVIDDLTSGRLQELSESTYERVMKGVQCATGTSYVHYTKEKFAIEIKQLVGLQTASR